MPKNSKDAAARTFKVDQKRIREWCKQQNDLQALKDEKGQKKKRLGGGGRKLTSEHLEEMLLSWIENQLSLKNRVSRGMIMRKAVEFFRAGKL